METRISSACGTDRQVLSENGTLMVMAEPIGTIG
jgi:hypothetical protein